jgi:hypothetical protein
VANKKNIPVRIGEVILRSKGFVHVQWQGENSIELIDVKEQIEVALSLVGKSSFVVLLDAGGQTLDVLEESMTYIAKYENEEWLAFAIVVRSISERLFANYYLKFKKPVRPTKVFTTPKGAEEWLGQFRTIDK